MCFENKINEFNKEKIEMESIINKGIVKFNNEKGMNIKTLDDEYTSYDHDILCSYEIEENGIRIIVTEIDTHCGFTYERKEQLIPFSYFENKGGNKNEF